MLCPKNSVPDSTEGVQTNSILRIYKLYKKIALFPEGMNMRADEVVNKSCRKIIKGINDNINIAKKP